MYIPVAPELLIDGIFLNSKSNCIVSSGVWTPWKMSCVICKVFEKIVHHLLLILLRIK